MAPNVKLSSRPKRDCCSVGICGGGMLHFDVRSLTDISLRCRDWMSGPATPRPFTLTIFGSGISDGSTIHLVCPGQPDIVGTTVVLNFSGTRLTATFDLVGIAPGECAVTVATLDGTIKTAAKQFT